MHILYGAGVGVVSGLTQWQAKSKVPDFDVWKLLPSLAISGLAGAILGASGVIVTDAVLGPAIVGLSSAGVDVLVQKAFKLLKKKFG